MNHIVFNIKGKMFTKYVMGMEEYREKTWNIKIPKKEVDVINWNTLRRFNRVSKTKHGLIRCHLRQSESNFVDCVNDEQLIHCSLIINNNFASTETYMSINKRGHV